MPALHLRALSLAAGVLSVLLTVGCGLFEEDTEVRAVAIERFSVVEQADRTVRFNVVGLWTNTCGTFSHFETDRDGTTYTVTLYGQQPKEAICGHAITTITGEWSVTVPDAGRYHMQFQRGEAASRDTTLVFGQVEGAP